MSREMFYLLALKTTGSAGLEVRQHASGEGFSLWYKWRSAHAQASQQQSLGILQSVLGYRLDVSTPGTLRKSLTELDLKVAEYSRVDQQGIQDSILIAVVVKQLPQDLRQHIELNLSSFSSYQSVRAAVMTYSDVRSEFRATVYAPSVVPT
eukprot:2964497-Amphidinium_carterae.1